MLCLSHQWCPLFVNEPDVAVISMPDLVSSDPSQQGPATDWSFRGIRHRSLHINRFRNVQAAWSVTLSIMVSALYAIQQNGVRPWSSWRLSPFALVSCWCSVLERNTPGFSRTRFNQSKTKVDETTQRSDNVTSDWWKKSSSIDTTSFIDARKLFSVGACSWKPRFECFSFVDLGFWLMPIGNDRSF